MAGREPVAPERHHYIALAIAMTYRREHGQKLLYDTVMEQLKRGLWRGHRIARMSEQEFEKYRRGSRYGE